MKIVHLGHQAWAELESISKLHEQVTHIPTLPTKFALEDNSQFTPMVIWGFLYEQLKDEEKAWAFMDRFMDGLAP